MFSSRVLKIVEAVEEEQVGDLFDNFERVGNAAKPERVPDAVYLPPDFTGDQCVRSIVYFWRAISAAR